MGQFVLVVWALLLTESLARVAGRLAVRVRAVARCSGALAPAALSASAAVQPARPVEQLAPAAGLSLLALALVQRTR